MSDSILTRYGMGKGFSMYDAFGNAIVGKFFVILNLERMTSYEKPVFWKPDGNGYTDNILLAGIYSEDELKKQCLDADDPVVPVQELSNLIRCDAETLKRFVK